MTAPVPRPPTDLATLEAQVAQLTDPAMLADLDAALCARPTPAALAETAALLSDLRLTTLLDEALSATAMPAGLADRVLAAAPLAAPPVAGRIEAKPAVLGQLGIALKKGSWRYAAVASISFSLGLMGVSFIVHQEAPMLASAWLAKHTSPSDQLAKLQMVVLETGISDDPVDMMEQAELADELQAANDDFELAGL